MGLLIIFTVLAITGFMIHISCNDSKKYIADISRCKAKYEILEALHGLKFIADQEYWSLKGRQILEEMSIRSRH